jgi:ParB/RepB/Spo0J family partition protein
MTDERNIQLIPIASIDRDGENHRLAGPSDQAAIRQLADSMRVNNLLQPVRVLHRPPASACLLIFGFRRVAAAELLGWTEIAAEVIEAPLEPADVARMRAVENLDRKDLNPIEEAVAVAQLMDAAGGDVGKCAAIVGRSESWVRDRCYLQRLGGKVRAMVIEGRLLLGHAREIAKLADTDAQETLADWAKIADDGTCHLRLSQLRRSVEERMHSLKVVPWQLDVDFANKPACSACPNNSDNDRNLFEHDEGAAKEPKGFCMSPACYAVKQAAAQKAMEKTVNKAVNQGLAATEKAVDKVSPDFLKPSRVVREVKKARGEDVEREARPKDEGAAPASRHSPEEVARAKLQAEIGKWEDRVVEAIAGHLHGQPKRLAALLLLGETKWAAGLWDAEELSGEGHALLQAAGDCNLESLAGAVTAGEGYEPPILRDLPDEVTSILAAAWGLDVGARPTLADVTDKPEPYSAPPADRPTHAQMREQFAREAASGTAGKLREALDRLDDGPTNGDGLDCIRREVIEAEITKRNLPPANPADEIEALDLSDPLTAKLRRHGLETVAAIEAAGGANLADLSDLGAASDRFGPREIAAIRKAIKAHEAKLAAHVTGPASDGAVEARP